MVFCTSQASKRFSGIEVKHDGISLDIKPTAKYLGVVLDSHLRFDAHTNYVKSKTIGKLKLLGRVRGSINRSTAELLYTNRILPQFEYANVVYHCLSQRDALTLQRLQNMGIKMVLQADKRAHTTDIHEAVDLPYLIYRRDINTATMMYKVDKKIAPMQICNMFHKKSAQSSRCTRQSSRGDYVVPKCRLQLGKQNFRYRGPKIWECT